MANDGIRLARYTPTNHPMLEPTKDNSTIVNFSQEYAVVNFIHMLHLVHLNEGLRLEREARKKPGKKISLIKKIDLALISRP